MMTPRTLTNAFWYGYLVGLLTGSVLFGLPLWLHLHGGGG